MSSANPDDVAQLLADWRFKIEAATANLLELSESPVRQQLLRPQAAPLRGQTRPQVAAALEAIGELFQGFSLLTDVIERASALQRAPLWPWQSEERRRQVLHLLREESIELGWEATPLARRGLLSATGRARRVSPEELLRAMTKEFEAARDTLLRVARAWDELPVELSALENELASAVGTGQAHTFPLDAAISGEITAIVENVMTLRAQIFNDPVGASEQWPTLRARWDGVRAQIEANTHKSREVTGALARADALLSDLNALHARAEDALAEARLAVQTVDISTTRTPRTPEQINDLSSWLETLRATASAGRSEAARVGLARWHEQIARELESERGALEANRALLRRRDELGGLLDALGAKARSLTARGLLLDPVLEQAAMRAKALLRVRPTPLEQVERLVVEFEKGLARAGK